MESTWQTSIGDLLGIVLYGTSRDLTWDALYTVSERLNRRAKPLGISIRAVQHFSPFHWKFIAGIELRDHGTVVHEPACQRRPFKWEWEELQPTPEAASKIGRYLRKRTP